MINAQEFIKALDLEILVDAPTAEWDIPTADINRPGMQLCGIYEYFAFERPQVLGKVELTYLYHMSPEERVAVLEPFFAYAIPCVIICRGMDAPEELLTIARARQVHVFRTQVTTSKFGAAVIHYLNRCLAPHMLRHGDLLDVYGIGVLLSGKSGVGKSEAALELVRRGHQLVADDVVDVCRIADDRLIGKCPKPIRHFMEIRGIGIIDIKAMYGVGAVSLSKTIDLIIELEAWNDEKAYDRLGVEEHYTELLDVSIPTQVIPVMPGRNLAIIVEVAARNLSLKRSGYNSARELLHGLQDMDEMNKIHQGGMDT